jgi:hypothetical protein
VRLTTRDDPEQGRVRVVAWGSNSESDLSGLVLVAALVVVCTVSSLVAADGHGALRVVLIVVAIISGLYFAAIAVPLTAVFVGVYVVKGLLAKSPSTSQRVSWFILAAGLRSSCSPATMTPARGLVCWFMETLTHDSGIRCGHEPNPSA